MMKHMKIYKLLIALPLLAGLQACSGWLDLEPKDTTTETDLFQTGDGYRIALNGVYQQMSETGLYGKELSWGFLDVLAQMYWLNNRKSNLYKRNPENFIKQEVIDTEDDVVFYLPDNGRDGDPHE